MSECLEDQGVDRRITLKWIILKQAMMLGFAFLCHRPGSVLKCCGRRNDFLRKCKKQDMHIGQLSDYFLLKITLLYEST
jgi:hypothetical protein